MINVKRSIKEEFFSWINLFFGSLLLSAILITASYIAPEAFDYWTVPLPLWIIITILYVEAIISIVMWIKKENKEDENNVEEKKDE